jgi:Trypsin-like peptidase domain
MMFNNQRVASGTAFVVQGQKDPLLITNRHNVTGRHQETGAPLDKKHGAIPNALEVLHNVEGKLGNWQKKREPLFNADGSPRWIEHPKYGAKADFVAVPLTQVQDVELIPFDPANPGSNIAIGPTSTVSVIGYPFGLLTGGPPLGIWATGFVASVPDVDAIGGMPTMLIDCKTRQGQSGSPVLAYREGGAVSLTGGSVGIFDGPVQRFLGVYGGRITGESDLGVVWKASATAELVASIK